MRFLGIILRVLRLGVSVYNVYITNQFQTTFAGGGGGVVKYVSRGDSEMEGGKLLSQLRPRIRPLLCDPFFWSPSLVLTPCFGVGGVFRYLTLFVKRVECNKYCLRNKFLINN
jgi:hypothetical protein